MLDEEFTNINMMLNFYKYGFGRATDLVSEMIRDGSLDRSTGIEIVEKYDGVCDDSIIKKYCQYVSITEEAFGILQNSGLLNPSLTSIGVMGYQKVYCRV